MKTNVPEKQKEAKGRRRGRRRRVSHRIKTFVWHGLSSVRHIISKADRETERGKIAVEKTSRESHLRPQDTKKLILVVAYVCPCEYILCS